jgi:hypothetical protein
MRFGFADTLHLFTNNFMPFVTKKQEPVLLLYTLIFTFGDGDYRWNVAVLGVYFVFSIPF